MKQSCIILAGGFGTRLREAVPDRPKCLAPIGSRSFIEIQLELLAAQGITEFVLALGHLSSMVEIEAERLAGSFSIQCVVEPSPLGTGGAIAYAMKALGLSEALVTNGDTFLGGNLSEMLVPLGLDHGESVRMAVIEVLDRTRFGGVALTGNFVTGFSEKGQAGPGAINAGLYRISSDIFSGVKVGEAFSLESHMLPSLALTGNLTAARITGAFTDIGVPDDYYRFCEEHA
jgi:D-glycero-alpha-D-manno-heptose 1-phosphate guanylyltransferase